jgi:hypothetical protein
MERRSNMRREITVNPNYLTSMFLKSADKTHNIPPWYSSVILSSGPYIQMLSV